MTVLLKAADLVKRPVVTLAGENLAQIKDVIYSSQTGELSGFTLNGLGLFSGPLRKTLPWENVHGLGPAAVMIRDENSLADRKALRGETEGAGGAVLGSTVITESGRNLGVVTDLILAVGDTMTDAVGYEIDPVDASAPRRQFVPLPDTLSVSGEALMVPDSATEFIRDDLAGFGAAVEEFRSRLHADAKTPAEPTTPAEPKTVDDPKTVDAPETPVAPATGTEPHSPQHKATSSDRPSSLDLDHPVEKGAPIEKGAPLEKGAPAEQPAVPPTATLPAATEPESPGHRATEELPVDEPAAKDKR